MFPRDAITLNVNNETGTDYLSQLFLATSTRTFIYFSNTKDGINEFDVYCGKISTTTKIFDSMSSASQVTQFFENYVCNDAVYIDNVRNSFTSITYVPRDRTITLDPQREVTSSSSIVVSSSSSSPMYTQDAGNLSFELAIIIFCLFLMVIGFIAHSITPKKSWR